MPARMLECQRGYPLLARRAVLFLGCWHLFTRHWLRTNSPGRSCPALQGTPAPVLNLCSALSPDIRRWLAAHQGQFDVNFPSPLQLREARCCLELCCLWRGNTFHLYHWPGRQREPTSPGANLTPLGMLIPPVHPFRDAGMLISPAFPSAERWTLPLSSSSTPH